jgi:hypothetical protein
MCDVCLDLDSDSDDDEYFEQLDAEASTKDNDPFIVNNMNFGMVSEAHDDVSEVDYSDMPALEPISYDNMPSLVSVSDDDSVMPALEPISDDDDSDDDDSDDDMPLLVSESDDELEEDEDFSDMPELIPHPSMYPCDPNFDFILSYKNEVKNAYKIVQNMDMWNYLLNHTPDQEQGFMWSNDPKIIDLMNAIADDYSGHNSCSLGVTMRIMHFIAKHGYDAYREEMIQID